MPTPTLEPIATTTLASAAASITFSGIPNTYTDLRLVVSAIAVDANSAAIGLRFNSDTATNYSNTTLEGYGGGSPAYASGRSTGMDRIYSATTALNSANAPFLTTADVFSYAKATYKTVLMSNSADSNGQGTVGRIVGLWRSTSAINAVLVMKVFGGNFAAGTTATLYGIKAA